MLDPTIYKSIQIFSAFKEDEGKYKVVPAAERNVNALDFFK